MAFGYFLPRDLKDLWQRPRHHFTAWRRGQDNLLKRMHVEETFRMIDPQPEDEILEIGAAMLHYSGEIAKRCKALVALDYLPGFGAPLRSFRMPQALKAVRADAQSLPFADESFDKDFISEVFSVLPAPDICAKEIMRVLRPGGTVTTVHGDIHRRMEDAMSTQHGQRLVQEAHLKWGTPLTFEEFSEQFFVLHGTNSEFFENRDQYVMTLLKEAGMEVSDMSWRVGRSAQLKYCELMLTEMAKTGVPALGFDQVQHLPALMKLDREEMPMQEGLTFFCKAGKR
jgi:SAM-dependent methyltransferase